MAGKKENLSDLDINITSSAADMHIGIVVSEWNQEITSALLNGAIKTMQDLGVKKENISVHFVPGSFELPYSAKLLIGNTDVDGVICLGCVIQGETRHFEFISNAVANGITKVSIETKKPVVFGVLTPDNYEQAKDRAGGKLGNKGVEAGATVVKMIELKNSLK